MWGIADILLGVVSSGGWNEGSEVQRSETLALTLAQLSGGTCNLVEQAGTSI